MRRKNEMENKRKICKNREHRKGLAAALMVMMMLAAGCGTNDSDIETDVGTVTTGDVDTGDMPTGDVDTGDVTTGDFHKSELVTPLTDYVSVDEMAEADMWKSCDDTALAAVMRKARDGEPVTIACIGGSITQGTISNGTDDSDVPFKKAYAGLFEEWWTNTFPDTEVTFINAGIGATDSYLGVHRVQKDVLDNDPDLVLVEYSVNDQDTVSFKMYYDNLVRKLLLSESQPAVMLLFMGQTNGATAQASHAVIGFNYKLPMVSYINVINDMMENDIYTAAQLSGDEVHPSALGHAITGEILWKYLNSVYENVDTFDEPVPFDQEAVTNDAYQNGELLDSASITPDSLGSFAESSKFDVFPNDWTCEEGSGELTFTMSFRNLGIMYYCTTDGLSGQFEVWMDGAWIATLDADFYGGWGNFAESKEVYTSDTEAEHTVVIRKKEDSTGDVFTILNLLVSH